MVFQRISCEFHLRGTYEEFGAASTMYGAAIAASNPYGTGCVVVKENYASGSPVVLLGSDLEPADTSLAFGQSIAMNDSWLFVGAPGAGSGEFANAGAVYAIPFPLQFDESSNLIFQKIAPPASILHAQFGAAIAASSNRLVVSSQVVTRAEKVFRAVPQSVSISATSPPMRGS